MSFMTVNGTGTGELAIPIDTVDRIQVGPDAEIDCKSLGCYTVEWDLKAVPDPDCEQSPCEMWLPGTYNIILFRMILLQLFAMGMQCGASIPTVHAIYDEVHLPFEISQITG